MANTITFRTSLTQNPIIFEALRPRPSSPSLLKISSGMRGGTRKPLWRKRVLSSEAIQAVHSLKLAKSPLKLQQVFSSKIGRLLKADLLDALTELQRQNEMELALKVFEFVKKEEWYEPDTSLFSNMIMILGKNKQIEMAEKLFREMVREEGLKPDTSVYTEMIGAYLRIGMVTKAMEMYEEMKVSGCPPDKLTLTILIRNLEAFGEEEHLAFVKRECDQYVDLPRKFLEEVDMKFPKRRSLDFA
ncbi:protein THYLAKOID ASSEMBLY 8-like, chloroplastic [Impatiens glandulifera]|uniref:protein THYLAKOID ASSEMBLY 8-like, chloroplastic n=1 Tax=Impatiens glandulifera TaxID=253017 RepID=UPI001FB05AF9|nr:protein THYLAKOID ASSEMBLY 8-like, chloroplastic [Impatiens glandulifera]